MSSSGHSADMMIMMKKYEILKYSYDTYITANTQHYFIQSNILEYVASGYPIDI